jgi:hypothetical protein
MAQGWLRECVESHELCKVSKPTTPPTRLLRIGPELHQIRLEDDIHTSPSYATLSHCWGSHEILQLTTKSLQDFLQLIPFESLCKTFQDAVALALSSGFCYLWIDSLCILQDDTEDWIKESALMSDVYGGSSLNIAAAGARDGREGLYFQRIPISLKKRQAYIPVTVNGEARVFKLTDTWTYDRCTSSQPLASRAWALQERFLPTRILHFGRSEILWECRSIIACETFPHGFPRYRLITPHYLPRHTLPNWQTIVALYTHGNLSKSTDKLVALSGQGSPQKKLHLLNFG